MNYPELEIKELSFEDLIRIMKKSKDLDLEELDTWATIINELLRLKTKTKFQWQEKEGCFNPSDLFQWTALYNTWVRNGSQEHQLPIMERKEYE